MHFAFIPYGMKSCVDLLIKEMEAQKHLLKLKASDGTEKGQFIQGQVRLMPLGIVEYVFPREDVDIVLNTLIEHPNRYELPKPLFFLLRKFLRLKAIPKYKTEKKMLWIRDNVNIIPLGIREDVDLFEEEGEFKGFSHEAI